MMPLQQRGSIFQTDRGSPVISRPEYTVFYEATHECVVVHCSVYKWTVQTRRRFLKDINTAQTLLGEPVYARWEGTELHKKFLTQHGFIPAGVAINLETQDPVAMFCRPFPGKPILLWEIPDKEGTINEF